MQGEKILVKKRNGRLEDFDVSKINACAVRACEGIEDVSASEIVIDANLQIYNKILTSDIDRALIMSARSKIEKEPNYSYVASRLLLQIIYKEVFGEKRDNDAFELQYRSSFIKNIKKMVRSGKLSDQMLKFDLKKLADAIRPSRDLQFKYLGIQNIYDRYLLKLDNELMESPQSFYMRVAMGLSFNEKNRDEFAIDMYNVYSQFLASPSTPTLFNSGTMKPQLSSCFLSEISDSIDGIFDGLWQEARKSKFAGGLGFHVSKIRAANSNVKGTDGKSSGVIPWLKIYNDMLVACDQGGKRPGSGCAFLENWHLDVEDFIDLRKSTGEDRRRTHDMNTALWISDLFMKRVESDANWTLFCPSEVGDLTDLYGEAFEKRYSFYEDGAKNGNIKCFRIIKAKDLWKKMLRSYFETAHPWFTWKDTANSRYTNIHEGVLHGSNLCQEITLHTKSSEYNNGKKVKIGETAVCNLHSVNISSHVERGKINFHKLSDTVNKCVRALDNVIDLNFYPTEEASNSNLRHRPVGLGAMGWADLYYKLNIIQDSDEGIKMADSLMEFISLNAISASNGLAQERGAYSSYTGSLWSNGILPIDSYCNCMTLKDKSFTKKSGDFETLDWSKLRKSIAQYGMRNSNVMAVAPTASISYQHGCEQSHEPNYSALFVYENKSGNLAIINEYFVNDMKKEGIWNEQFAKRLREADGDVTLLDIPIKYKEKYKTAFDRDQFKLIDACAARQKWIDQGLSFNSYNKGTSLKFLNDIYFHSWRSGLKSNYYLRNRAASKVEKSVDFIKNNPTTSSTDEKAACSLESARLGIICESCQ